MLKIEAHSARLVILLLRRVEHSVQESRDDERYINGDAYQILIILRCNCCEWMSSMLHWWPERCGLRNSIQEALRCGNGKPGDGSAYKAPGKRFSYYHYSRWHNPSAHRLTAVDEVCYNCAIFKVKNRGFAMALSSRFEEALVFATRLHAGQRRKGTAIPYISHLLGVTSIVLEQDGNEDEAIAALLHDAIEDQGGAATREEIRRRFGNTVVAIVNGCTDAEVVPKPPWRRRKEAYIAHLRDAPASVRLVSAADKLHNARAILADYRSVGESLWKRFHGGKTGTLWYYRTLVDVLRKTGPAPLFEELERVVSEIETLTAEDSA